MAHTEMKPYRVVHHTQSLCPRCLARIPARYEQRCHEVWLVKECPEHGRTETPVWRGGPDMSTWLRPKLPTPPAPLGTVDRGCPFDCGLCPQHNQHTCTAVFEVTTRCNLRCRYCFAAAQDDETQTLQPSAHVGAPPLHTLVALLEAVRQKTGPCNIQLSGGEPTLRHDLCDIVSHARRLFPFVQLNTNGILLGRQPSLAHDLARAGLDSVFLQFDGTSQDIHEALRGAPLLDDKRRAIDALGEAGVGVVLVPTVVPGVNDHDVGAIIRLGMSLAPAVRGVHFQPVSHFGRHPSCQGAPYPSARITLPELMHRLEEQTAGMVQVVDFLPPGCEHSLCSFHANYLVREDGTLMRVSAPRAESAPPAHPALDGAIAARAFVRRQWAAPGHGAPVHDACGCGTDGTTSAAMTAPISSVNADVSSSCPAAPCGHSPSPSGNAASAPSTAVSSGTSRNISPDTSDVVSPAIAGQPRPDHAGDDLDRFLARAATHLFAISAMAFQDAWNLDLERLQGCCIHAVTTDGALIPFCAWNCTAADGTPLYRGRT